MEDPLLAIFGVSARELFRERELFATHGALERLPAFMRSGPLESVDSLCRHYSGPVEVAQGSAEAGLQVPVRDVPAATLLGLGLTVYFTELRRALPFANGWLQALERSLGVPECASLVAFANAPGSGLSLHHDRFDQLFFQLRGTKRFRHAPNGLVEHPDLQFSPTAAAPAEFGRTYRHGFPRPATEGVLARLETVALAPGSAFFMPAGTWHTTAEQEAESLSMVIVVRAPSRLDVLLNYLDDYAGQAPEWRRRAYGAWSDDESARAEQAAFARLTADLGRRLPALPPASAFAAWSAQRHTTGAPTDFQRTLPCERFIPLPNASAHVAPADVPGKLRCVVAIRTADRPSATANLTFPAEARPLLEWLLGLERAFTLDEAAASSRNLSCGDIADVLASLTQAGLIRPLAAPDWGSGLGGDPQGD